MRHDFAKLICLAGILWMVGQIQGIGALQLPGLQEASAQSQKASPEYADVAPIFSRRCTLCHSGSQPPQGLELDSYANIMSGSWTGPVVVVANPEGSELVRRIRGLSQPRMPLNGPPWLSDSEIELIERWIAAGAPEGQKGGAAEPPSAEATPPKTVKDQPLTYAQVAPILGKRCVKCHTANGLMGPAPEGLRLDSYEAVMAGRDRVRVIAGFPDASELVRRIRGQSLPRMPFDGPPYLDEAEIKLIADWIEQGARNTDGTPAAIPVGARVRLEGRLSGRWSLDGLPLVVDSSTRLQKAPSVGNYVEVRGVVLGDGRIRATRIRPRKIGH